MADQDKSIEVLLVEDNPGDVNLTQRLLKDCEPPVHFTVAEDGDIALECLRRQGEYAETPKPDLILLDLAMPRKGGIEVLGEMKEDPDLQNIPVLILTSRESEASLLSSMGMHPSRWCQKPIDVARFTRLIKGLQFAPTPASFEGEQTQAAEEEPKTKRRWFGRNK